MTSFHSLGLCADLMRALDEEGYTTPTPIQAQAIPGVLAGRDLLGIAQTGTGKTAAFALPILQRLAADRRPAQRRGCRVLVLSPTRELASQIAESFRNYGRHLGMTVAVVFGGVGHRPQITALARGVDILVATPGRLIDHMDERNISLEGTEIFVLDEADQMLDLGFVKPIRRIVSKLSARRQSLFFSATMPHEIGALAGELLTEPVKVSVAPAATTVERVTQRIILIEQTRKRSLLVDLLRDAAMQRTLVFTRTKRGADRVARHLEVSGIAVAAIHGNKSQRQREEALEDFRQARIRVLVATDIAARGIDIDEVTHVVNFELPDVPESYVHRIGRTARAGAAGVAIALVDREEYPQLRDIEKVTRQRFNGEDRRNDATLEADAKTPGGGRGEDRREHGREGRGRDGGRGREQRGFAGGRERGGDGRGARPGAARQGGDSRRGDLPGEHRHQAPRRDGAAAGDTRGREHRAGERPRAPSRPARDGHHTDHGGARPGGPRGEGRRQGGPDRRPERSDDRGIRRG